MGWVRSSRGSIELLDLAALSRYGAGEITRSGHTTQSIKDAFHELKAAT
jgi:hypothetical protein